MKNKITAIGTAVLIICVSGCSSMPESQATVDARNGPEFTQEQKDAMTTDEKVALFNEEVREQDKVVCRRERTVGSRMNTTRCTSQADREAAHENSREALRNAQNDTHIRGSGN